MAMSYKIKWGGRISLLKMLFVIIIFKKEVESGLPFLSYGVFFLNSPGKFYTMRKKVRLQRKIELRLQQQKTMTSINDAEISKSGDYLQARL